VKRVVTPDELDGLASVVGVESDWCVPEEIEQMVRADTQGIYGGIPERANFCAVVQDHDCGLNSHTTHAAAQECFEITCDLGDLAAPATSTSIDKHSLLDQISVPVEFLISPLVSADMNSNSTILDLDRPDSTRPDGEMIDLTSTVGVPTEQQPIVGQPL
jgi:hypothetical protein